jgi:Glyoxalase-like domain
MIEEPRPGHDESAVGMEGQGCPRLYFVRVPEAKTIKNRVHLDITPADRTQDDEINRLVAVGARIVSDGRPEFGWVLLADPEGNEFDVEISVAELDAARAAEAGAGWSISASGLPAARPVLGRAGPAWCVSLIPTSWRRLQQHLLACPTDNSASAHGRPGPVNRSGHDGWASSARL